MTSSGGAQGGPALATVSIVVPVYNDAQALARLLACLARQSYPKDLTEVLVVDNGSSEPIAPVVERHLPSARLLHEPRPGSYAARNKGLSEAKGTLVAFTDADCQPADDWLERGVAALQADPSLGIVAGHVEVFPRDADHPTGAELYDMTYTLRQEHYLAKNKAAATANVFTRRAVIDAVGPFNSALKSAGDFEWCQRVHAAGYGLAYERTAVVRHPARPGMRPLLRKARRVIGGRVDKGERDMPARRRLRLWLRAMLPPRDVLPAARQHRERFGRGAAVRFFFAVYVARVVMVLEEMRILLGGSSVR